MGFSVFSNQVSPIAIDFGSSSVKALQVTTGSTPALVAAAELPIPDTVRLQSEQRNAFLAEALPELIANAQFKGRRVVCSPPSGQMLVQHLQVVPTPGLDDNEQIAAMLQVQLNCSPSSLVVRSEHVGQTSRDGQVRQENICFAVSRDEIMRYVEMFKKNKLSLVGVHSEIPMLLRSFDHLHRRDADAQVNTLYVDLGWGHAKVAISHGTSMVFAKCIQLGGRHFDQLVSDSLHCDLDSARKHRIRHGIIREDQQPSNGAGRSPLSGGMAMLRVGMAMNGQTEATECDDQVVAEDRRDGRSPESLPVSFGSGTPADLHDHVDFSELLESLSDELSMCLRYHNAMFPDHRIHRSIFLGGESRQTGLCHHLAHALQVPAQLGDPIARIRNTESMPELFPSGRNHCGWAVACGLCTAPTDL